VNRILEEAAKLLDRSWRTGCRRAPQLDPGVPSIVADSDRLFEMVLNIVRNAIEAMPDGGTLTIATLPLNDRVEVRFGDTGGGRARVDPGENLLSLLHDQAGRLGIGPERGETGSDRARRKHRGRQRARLRIDVYRDLTDENRGGPWPSCWLLTTKRTSARCNQSELTRDGHEVVVALDGQEALKLLEKEKPDLVVLDIRMPGIDGLETMARLLSRENTLP
jgi:hypothetical protein